MNIDVDSVNTDRIISLTVNHMIEAKKEIENKKEYSKEGLSELLDNKVPEQELDKVLEELKKIAEASKLLNKRVKLRVNKDINRIIITILDEDTSKIIKEIPCREIQNLAFHLKQAIGLLFDKKA